MIRKRLLNYLEPLLFLAFAAYGTQVSKTYLAYIDLSDKDFFSPSSIWSFFEKALEIY